jgi:hypothetical protein
MAHRLRPNAPLTGLVLAFALAACSGSSSNNAAPSFGTIPQQRVAGGTSFTLDLEPYVQDREDADATMTYSVVSGGGAIALGTPSGGVTPVEYTNDFDTLGNYTILVRATDSGGKSTDTSFDLEVTSARLAAVQQNTSGLLLLDVDTNATVQVVSGGNQPDYVGGTPLGCAIYQIGTNNADLRIWLTLPKQVLYARFPAPADGTVEIELGDGQRIGPISAESSGATIVHVRSPRMGAAPAVRTMRFPLK